LSYGIKLAVCGLVVVMFAVFEIVPERQLGAVPLILKGITEVLTPFVGVWLLVLLYPHLSSNNNDSTPNKK
jgi:hypothetical protein